MRSLTRDGASSTGPWFVQPLVTFIRGGRDRSRLRRTYSLTFFLIPVKGSDDLSGRRMPVSEIAQVVNLGWGFAAAPATKPAKFRVDGELLDYLSAVARWEHLGVDPRSRYAGSDLPLREIIEGVAFGTGLTVAQGRTGRADLTTARLIGNDVVMSLGSARVSSVVAADSLQKLEGEALAGEPALPKPLLSLMKELSDPIRVPQGDDPRARKYQLDRPFVDDEIYATGVLPTKRCLVTVSHSDAQFGVRESALMQAGSFAYMTIGSATAIGTMRAIDRSLEHLDGVPSLSLWAVRHYH